MRTSEIPGHRGSWNCRPRSSAKGPNPATTQGSWTNPGRWVAGFEPFDGIELDIGEKALSSQRNSWFRDWVAFLEPSRFFVQEVDGVVEGL